MEYDRDKVKMMALQARQTKCTRHEAYIIKNVIRAAYDGDFDTFIYKNVEMLENDEEDRDCTIILSKEFIQELRDNGYKVKLLDKRDGWDDLHRWYKGAVRIYWK